MVTRWHLACAALVICGWWCRSAACRAVPFVVCVHGLNAMVFKEFALEHALNNIWMPCHVGHERAEDGDDLGKIRIP